MRAFLRKENGYLIKVFEHKNDWQVIDSNGRERWRTIWTHYDRGYNDSLESAINVFMEQETGYEERFEDFIIT